MTAGAWIALHLWEHYEFNQDAEYLRGFHGKHLRPGVR